MAYDNIKQFPFKDGYSFLEFDGVDIGAACEMLNRSTCRDVTETF